MTDIRLNFIPALRQDFSVIVYRRNVTEDVALEGGSFYMLPIEEDEANKARYEVINHKAEGFEKFSVPTHRCFDVVGNRMYERLLSASESIDGSFVNKPDKRFNRRIHFTLEPHSKGRKCIWVEPYYLKSKMLWGIQLGFQFVVNKTEEETISYKLDKDILIASGSLNNRGQSNTDFYLFKHNYLQMFIKKVLPHINESLHIKFRSELLEVPSFTLKPKEYIFKDGVKGNSAYFGLSKFAPLSTIEGEYSYDFIYRPDDRQFAVSLLKGLRGETHPTTFIGIEKFFKIPFNNTLIKGTQLSSFSNEEISLKIAEIQSHNKPVLPVLITNGTDEKTYYMLKSKFTNAGIPCQVVTKELIGNQNSMKYSLGNIGLQMFAKLGGKPWKMRPAGNEYLIIGIGQSYNIEQTEYGSVVEKNISYSILTDSSGIFNDLKVLSEGVESDDTYWDKLVSNLALIIKNSGKNRVALHVPFRISKPKVLDKVSRLIGNNIELTVLVINERNDYFGFDYNNNGLVPFESTFVKLSKYDYLVWFEGLQPFNPKITKRFGNPLLIKFLYSNQPGILDSIPHRESLLQDCINLSGANWRGFKAKQLPVSIYYCQRIAEFISKFREYNLEHIDINNLKPWFL